MARRTRHLGSVPRSVIAGSIQWLNISIPATSTTESMNPSRTSESLSSSGYWHKGTMCFATSWEETTRATAINTGAIASRTSCVGSCTSSSSGANSWVAPSGPHIFAMSPTFLHAMIFTSCSLSWRKPRKQARRDSASVADTGLAASHTSANRAATA